MTDQPKPTPPLADFLTRYREDDNEWWVLSSGDHLNLFDAAVERFEVAEAKLARLDRLHQPRPVTEVLPCEAHRQFSSANAVASHVCPDCVSRPALACKDIRCCSWPCEPHLVLHDETTETCAHRAGEPGEAAALASRGGPVDFGEVSDDHGNAWPRCSETCDIHVVRPGFARCQCEPEEYPL